MEPLDAASDLSPSLVARVGPGNIRSLILEKEKELHDINEYRIRTLEALLRDKETAVTTAKQKLSKLQEDFKYNLKLLEGRDEELALYDANFASLKNVLRDREAELSEIRAREAEIQAELQRSKQRAGEQEVQYQQKLKDARARMEGSKWKFDDELRRQEDTMETLRRNTERQLREKDEDIENQRRELTVTLDDVMRQRETEFKRKLELKNKALTRDTDAQRVRAEELKTKNENLQQMLQENDKEMKSLEWTLADVKAAKDVKIGELESEVATLNEVKQKLLDEYESKMAELLQSLHAVEKAFVQQKTQYDEELQRHMDRKKSEAQEASARSEAKLEALTARLRESEERAEELQAELKQAKWDADDKLMEKEREVERVKSALQILKTNNTTLQERLQDSHRQIALLKEKDKAQRQELLESVEKQEDLQRELVTVNLRWENRWQEQQRELDERHELRLRELQQVKDRLLNEKEAVEEPAAFRVSTLKSSARISESFGSQYVAASARRSGEVRHSSDSVPVAPSPLWTDDPGTLSPMPGVSPLLTNSPQQRPRTEANNSASALEIENAKLRDLIRQMKESLALQMEASPGQASGNRSASKLAAQLLEAQERCVALEAKLNGDGSGIALELESCKRELSEAQQIIEVKNTRIAELEARIQELEGATSAEPDLQSGRVVHEAQLTDLRRKLDAQTLRADLRRSGSGDAGSKSSTPRVEFAGKKDYENMITELTRSLEEARVHNKTLKKELRRMVKLHAHNFISDDENGPERRRSSTLSMMKSLDPGPARPKTRTSTSASSRAGSEGEDGGGTTSKRDLDEQLLALARNKRPSVPSQATKTRKATRAVPPTISEHNTDSDAEADVSAEDDDRERGEARDGRESEGSNATIGGSSSAKVTDARLKLQQAKEMLMLSGKRAPVEGSRASLTTFAAQAATGAATATRKLKQLQSKRAEMVNERKKVRNYNLAS
ncbi:hypothetical protein GQ600_5857 [Phytophthora cactorum]|nr:hypothetical protein GQ600_5857 [Phytophthora cactorum]